jgi:hypothetical protein
MWCCDWAWSPKKRTAGSWRLKTPRSLQNMGYYLPNNRASHLRRNECSPFLLLFNTHALIYTSVAGDDFSVTWYTTNQMQHMQLLYITICSLVCKIIYNMVEVKLSLYKPGQAPRVPGDLDTQISRLSAHKDGKFVSPMHQPPLPPRK